MPVSKALEFIEHYQEVFAIARVFIRLGNFIFLVKNQAFAVDPLDRMMSFQLCVFVDG